MQKDKCQKAKKIAYVLDLTFCFEPAKTKSKT